MIDSLLNPSLVNLTRRILQSPWRRNATHAFAAIVLGIITAETTQALVFLPADEIYAEDFEMEIGFPTSPEVDDRSIGGVSPFIGLSEQPPLATISDGVVLLETSPFPDSLFTPFSANGFGWFVDESIPALGARITAGEHVIPNPISEWVGFEVVFNQFPSSVSNVTGGIAFEGSPAGPVLSLVSRQTTFQLPGGGSTTMEEIVPLDGALAGAILAGEFYELDVFIDSNAMTLVASLEIPGVGSAETPVLSLAGLPSGEVPLSGNVTMRQAIPFDPRSHTAQIESFRLYSAVPEPEFASALAMGAVVTGLASARRRRS